MSLACSIYNYHNPWLQHQAHQWGLTPPHHTHLGIRFIRLSILTFFKIHYLYSSRVGTWHSAPHSILVPERGTRSIYYPGVGTWHSDLYSILIPECCTRSIFYPGVETWHSDPHILSWYRNVAPDPLIYPLISLFSFIKPSFIPRHHH